MQQEGAGSGGQHLPPPFESDLAASAASVETSLPPSGFDGSEVLLHAASVADAVTKARVNEKTERNEGRMAHQYACRVPSPPRSQIARNPWGYAPLQPRSIQCALRDLRTVHGTA